MQNQVKENIWYVLSIRMSYETLSSEENNILELAHIYM